METIINTTNIEEAIQQESALEPGVYDIRFYLTEPVSKEDIGAIRDHLHVNGVDAINVTQMKSGAEWAVSVKYRKPEISESISFLPVAIVPLIAFGFVASLVGIGIFKMEDIANNIGKILLIGFGGATLLALAMRKPIESVASAYAGRKS